jgi:hypothetical protein
MIDAGEQTSRTKGIPPLRPLRLRGATLGERAAR